jgi:YD repeat-containing protein
LRLFPWTVFLFLLAFIVLLAGDPVGAWPVPQTQRLSAPTPAAIAFTDLSSDAGDLTGLDYSAGTPNVTFASHDRRGLPHAITDARGSRTIAYDLFGRVTSDTGASGD